MNGGIERRRSIQSKNNWNEVTYTKESFGTLNPRNIPGNISI